MSVSSELSPFARSSASGKGSTGRPCRARQVDQAVPLCQVRRWVLLALEAQVVPPRPVYRPCRPRPWALQGLVDRPCRQVLVDREFPCRQGILAFRLRPWDLVFHLDLAHRLDQAGQPGQSCLVYQPCPSRQTLLAPRMVRLDPEGRRHPLVRVDRCDNSPTPALVQLRQPPVTRLSR